MHCFRKFVNLFFLICVLTGCDNKNNIPLELPDTSDIPASYNNLIDDARLGRGNAQIIFAEMYDKGEDVPRNIDKSIAWYNIVIANTSNNSSVYYNIALLYFEKNELQKSISAFEKASNLGDIDAENQLAQIYSEHQELDDNYKKVLYWRESAAKKGDTLALTNLSAMYYAGRGVIKNEQQGFKLNLEAANLGDVNAMYFTGIEYFKGIYVQKDTVKAYSWIKRGLNESRLGSNISILKEQNIKLKKIEKELTPEQIAKVNKELGISE